MKVIVANKNYYLTYILPYLLILIVISCDAQMPVYRNYTMNDGLPSQVIYCALQDSEGYMWFGTDAGASRFDGKHFQNYTINDGLSDNEILGMFRDSKGRIWFHTLNGKLSYFYKDKIYNQQNDPQLKRADTKFTITSFSEDRPGNIYIGRTNGTLTKLGTNGSCTILTPGNSNAMGSRMWVYSYESGNDTMLIFSRLYPNKVFLLTQDHLGFIDVSDLHPTNSANFNFINLKLRSAIYTSLDGIRLLVGRTNKLLIAKEKIPDYDLLLRIDLDADMGIWVTTTNYKTYHFRKTVEGYKLEGPYFAGLYIGAMYEDAEGNKWFCSVGNGVFKLLPHPGQVLIFNKTFGQNDEEELWSVNIDRDENVWYGTSTGTLYCKSHDTTFQFNLHLSNERKFRITSITFDKNENVWCATGGGLFFLRRKGEPQKGEPQYSPPVNISLAVAKSDYMTKYLKFDRRGQLYASTIDGVLTYTDFNGSKYIGYLDTSIIPHHRVYCLYFDSHNNLWFENFEKLFCYDRKQLIGYPDLDHEFLSQITSIEGTADSALVIATYGSGIKFFKNGKIIRRLTASDGLAGNLCKKVFVDSNTIYVATNQGFTFFTYEGNSISNVKTFTTADGILSNDVKDICARGNKIYLATSLGLCEVDKQITQSHSLPPPIYITSVLSGDSTYSINNSLTIDYHSSITFNYAAPTFEEPEKVMYEYMLNSEPGNLIPTKENNITFSSLPPGHYIFKVRARKYNSEWSLPAAFEFNITPPFWQQWWFRLIMSVALAVCAFYIIRYIAGRRYRMQLERLRYQQTLADERNRISSDMHDDLGADLSNLLLLTRITGRNSHLEDDDKKQILKIESYTTGVIQKVDEIIWALNPTQDTLRDLIGFINDYCKQFLKLSELNGHLKFPESISDQPVSAVFRRNIFLVVKESLNNIIRHAEATNFIFELTLMENELKIRIEDNGKGFDLNAATGRGNGLFNMRKRIEELKGTFNIESGRDLGTTIQFFCFVGLNHPFR